MNSGVVQQQGSPRLLYEEPANEFVRDFLGRTFCIMGFAGPKTFAEILKSRHETPNLLGGIYAGLSPRIQSGAH